MSCCETSNKHARTAQFAVPQILHQHKKIERFIMMIHQRVVREFCNRSFQKGFSSSRLLNSIDDLCMLLTQRCALGKKAHAWNPSIIRWFRERKNGFIKVCCDDDDINVWNLLIMEKVKRRKTGKLIYSLASTLDWLTALNKINWSMLHRRLGDF